MRIYIYIYIYIYTYASYCVCATIAIIYPYFRASPVVQQETLRLQCWRLRRHGFDPWVGKIPWRTTRQPTPGFLPGESHGQTSLAGYSPGSRRESEATERLSLHCCLPLVVLGVTDTSVLLTNVYSRRGGGEKPGNKRLKVMLCKVLEVDMGDGERANKSLSRGGGRESALGHSCNGLTSLINAPLVYSQR